MHDSAIKNFCVWARRELMSEVERRCALYDISDHPENPKDAQAVGGRVLSSQERKQSIKTVMELTGRRLAILWKN